MTVAGKKADLSGVNRDTSNMVDVLKDRKINPVSIDLGTEYWEQIMEGKKLRATLRRQITR